MPNPSWLRVFGVSFVVWLILAGSWAIATPIFGSPDEQQHLIRSYSVAHGDVLGDRRDTVSGDPDNGEPVIRARFYAVEVPAGFEGSGSVHSCYIRGAATADCAQAPAFKPGTIQATTTAGAYQPLYYALTGLPSLLIDPPVRMMYVARLASAVLMALLLATATATAWMAGGPAVLMAVLLTATPMALFLGGSVNPNGVEVAGAIALWTGLPLLLRDRSRLGGITAVAGVTGLAWSRPPGPGYAIGAIVVCAIFAVERRGLVATLRSPQARPWLVWGGASLAVALAWVVGVEALSSFVAVPRPDLTPALAFDDAWFVRNRYVEQMIGVFGWQDVTMPDWMWQSWLTACLVLLGLGVVRGGGRARFVLVSMAVGTFMLPIAVGTLTAPSQGFVWQGRYTLAVGVGTILLAGWTVAWREDGAGREGGAWREGGARWVGPLAVVSSCVVATVHVSSHLVSMSTYSTGVDSPLLDYLGQPGWAAPAPDALLLTLVVLGALGLPALTVWCWRSSATPAAVAEDLAPAAGDEHARTAAERS